YNFLWRCLYPVIGLLLARRARAGKEDKTRLDERFGRYEKSYQQGCIWLHAVSVGETIAALALAEAMHDEDKGNTPIIITTNTVTAAEMVDRAKTRATITHIYQPLDHPAFVDRFLDMFAPQVAIFLESDFWPNLVTRTAARHIPVIFASAQLSQKAVTSWRRQLSIAHQLFGCADLILAVDADQQNHFITLGATASAVHVGGSLKMTPTNLPIDADLQTLIRKASGKRAIFLAASTHEGEDEAAIEVARQHADKILTIIAPRHPERGDAIAAMAHASLGQAIPQRSQKQKPDTATALYMLDSLGEMGSVFDLADIVFLGGSLVPKGGHNPLEPASFGVPIITGPHIFKNETEFNALSNCDIIHMIDQPDDLGAMVTYVLGFDSRKKQRQAEAAINYVENARQRPIEAARMIFALVNAKAVDR
ncbi:MAG: 3-deoxy-D-manno-octulosonic acid transferase, partial [Candidatus Puniceispirillum sp.]